MMRKLTVFNQVSLDGFFQDLNGDMSWAHKQDEEFMAFAEENSKGGGELVFGRVTYQMMASYWPTPFAAQNSPSVAEAMNSLPKIVFSSTLTEATWSNTRLIKTDIVDAMSRLKQEPGKDLVIMGSGTLVSQFASADLIDEYQLVINPILLGQGRSIFEGLSKMIDLTLSGSRVFQNGNVFLKYERR